MSTSDLQQISLALVFNESEEETAGLEITLGEEDTEAACAVNLEGISLLEFSLALQSAVSVVQDLLNWERVSALAEKEMRQAQGTDAFPF